MRQLRLASVLACALMLTLFCGRSSADPMLLITEIWAGGLSGTEATSDWFEVTNFGDMAATGLDGNLYYDDDSADPTANDPMVGIDTIGDGESVIYLVSWEDDYNSAAEATTAFLAQWGPLPGVQIGTVTGGGGLGGSGDTAYIFDGNTVAANTLDAKGYSVETGVESFVSNPDSTWVENTLAVAGVWGAYESNNPASDGVFGIPAVGSPGVVVPEPATMSLVLLGSVGLVLGRRRRM